MGTLSPIARLGDTSDHGGTIITASTVVSCDGIGVAGQGDLHSCPIPGHGVTPLISGSDGKMADGLLIIRIGDIAECGAVVITGSPVSSST